jgi:hypothetical protein
VKALKFRRARVDLTASIKQEQIDGNSQAQQR